MTRLNTFSLLALLCAVGISAQARVNVVTLPGRDSVQLTIYNSADLTLVKETRVLTFRKGLNKLAAPRDGSCRARPATSER